MGRFVEPKNMTYALRLFAPVFLVGVFVVI